MTSDVEYTQENQDTESISTIQSIETLIKDWDETIRGLKTFTSRLRALKKEVISLEKEKEKLSRSKRKKRQNEENKKPSGFAVPKEISNELADFLGKEHGELVARTEVTKLLTAYVKENELNDPDNKRNIILSGEAGEKLRKILSPLVDDEGNEVTLSYFNLQKFIKHHFPTTKKNVEAAAMNAAHVMTSTPVKKKKIVRKVVKKAVATA